jgi:hypothetical protein
MKTVSVRPVQGGWSVVSDLSVCPLSFLSGAAAERQARRLALLHEQCGDSAQVLIHDRRGVLVGSQVGPGRRPNPAFRP